MKVGSGSFTAWRGLWGEVRQACLGTFLPPETNPGCSPCPCFPRCSSRKSLSSPTLNGNQSPDQLDGL